MTAFGVRGKEIFFVFFMKKIVNLKIGSNVSRERYKRKIIKKNLVEFKNRYQCEAREIPAQRARGTDETRDFVTNCTVVACKTNFRKISGIFFFIDETRVSSRTALLLPEKKKNRHGLLVSEDA